MSRGPAMRECGASRTVVGVGGATGKARKWSHAFVVRSRGPIIPVSSQLFPDLNERIADFERRMADLQAEIDRLPQGKERRDALDAIAEVARALAALKARKT
jgi:hypothetical protein